MARVTVEDCIGKGKTNNKYELVTLAAQRAKDIHAGAEITVSIDNDKKTVIALREIAAGNIKIEDLKTRFISSLMPKTALTTLDEDFELVDKDIKEEFAPGDADYGLTEDQMNIEDDSMYFDNVDPSDIDEDR
ncbi:MAG: DNA-directed RNA polymerase subunit omega [Alphaproteobacteria bacterium]|nr:DNA-directed RNA polymerase subunit omega [Alphaproteobacteria bacterium]